MNPTTSPSSQEFPLRLPNPSQEKFGYIYIISEVSEFMGQSFKLLYWRISRLQFSSSNTKLPRQRRFFKYWRLMTKSQWSMCLLMKTRPPSNTPMMSISCRNCTNKAKSLFGSFGRIVGRIGGRIGGWIGGRIGGWIG